jgi:hypothetical protein
MEGGVEKLYISNAFSLSMLPAWVWPENPDGVPVGMTLKVEPILDPRDLVLRHLAKGGVLESCVGHPDTASVFSSELGIQVDCRRVSVSLHPGKDAILVGQYTGPRLPEGATSLPEGAKILWYLVTLEG